VPQGLLALHRVIALCAVLHYISGVAQHQRNTRKGEKMKARMKMTFEKYMAEVDWWIGIYAAGLTIRDLPDWDYATAYEDGVWPRNAAARAIKAAEEG
jgi:hypothetical protein